MFTTTIRLLSFSLPYQIISSTQRPASLRHKCLFLIFLGCTVYSVHGTGMYTIIVMCGGQRHRSQQCFSNRKNNIFARKNQNFLKWIFVVNKVFIFPFTVACLSCTAFFLVRRYVSFFNFNVLIFKMSIKIMLKPQTAVEPKVA